MISARLIVILSLCCLASAVLGAVTVMFGYEAGRVLVLVSVPVGALSVVGGAIAAQTGHVKDDLRK